MELTENEIIENLGELYMHCLRKTLLPHENKCTCFACGKKNLPKTQRKRVKFF